ncbi:MAG TPA: RNA polymerase sigma factor [Candidatus Hydrogenedentes bacterium]|nr:RNA polymerase sigma factor [Candidatus Hydrogenedentota bacterium]HPG67685.1 RNA polymerase sigma factor [Candidatus Hydrogenedentota bacterium]
MARVCQGDEDSLTELLNRYQMDVFRFCMHYLREVERAKEMTQETFLRLYVARHRFDTDRRFKPWILCIARNLCLNELKRSRVVAMESLDLIATSGRETLGGPLVPRPEDSPDARAMATERREILERALDTLDDEAREIVTLRFFERMQARDIAEIVGSTEGAIRTRVHRILRTLRSQMEQDAHAEL